MVLVKVIFCWNSVKYEANVIIQWSMFVIINDLCTNPSKHFPPHRVALLTLFCGHKEIITPPHCRPTWAEYCNEHICLWQCESVCLSVREHISRTTRPNFHQIHCACCPWPAVHRSSTGGVGRSNYDDVSPLVIVSSVQFSLCDMNETQPA